MFLSCSLHVSIVGLFTIRQKGIRGGVCWRQQRPAETTPAVALAPRWNNTGCCYEYAIVSVSSMARHYTIQCSVSSTRTRCTLSWTAGGRQAGRGRARSGKGRRVGEEGREQEGGREGGRGGRQVGREGGGRTGGREGGREEAMMLGRPRASVEEGVAEGEMVDEGKERGRDGAWTVGGRKRAEEGLSEQGRETSREVSWGGHWPVIKYSQTIPQRGPCHWYFVIINEKYWTCINYKLCVLFVRWIRWHDFMWWKLWPGCIWHGLGA